MKTLLICTEKLPVPPVRGGAIQTYIHGISDLLAREHDVTILGTTDPTLEEDEVVEGIRYVRIPGGLVETYREGISNFLADNHFDLIHIFNRPRYVLTVREMAPEAKIVLSMHNDMFTPEKIDPEEATAALAELERIVTVSDYVGQAIVELFPEAESLVHTIYSGVNLNRFVPPSSSEAQQMRKQIRAEHGLENKKVILFAGRLSVNKGADILVQAIPAIAEEHSDAALVIVGSKWFSEDRVSDYVAYVRALAAKLPIPVINTGFVDPTEIQKWLRPQMSLSVRHNGRSR